MSIERWMDKENTHTHTHTQITMWADGYVFCGHLFFIYQIITLYPLNLHNVVHQLYVNTAGKWTFRKNRRKYLDTEFLNVQSIKGKIYKLDLTKIKNKFCSVEAHVKRMKRQAKDLEKIFAIHIHNKELLSEHVKTIKTHQGKNNLIRK